MTSTKIAMMIMIMTVQYINIHDDLGCLTKGLPRLLK